MLITVTLQVGLARLIKILVNWFIYNRKTIINMKIKKSVTFNQRCQPFGFLLNHTNFMPFERQNAFQKA